MRFIVIVIAILTQSCQPTDTDQTFDAESIKGEAKSMLDDYHFAIKENGLKGEFKFLDSSSQFFWVPPGYHNPLDFDSVKTILLQSALAQESVDLQWDTLSLIPLSKSIVNYTGIVSGTMTDTAGVTNRVSIIESGTLIKRESGWKLLSGQSAALPLNDQ